MSEKHNFPPFQWGATVFIQAQGNTEEEAAADLWAHLPDPHVRSWGIKDLVQLDYMGNEAPSV